MKLNKQQIIGIAIALGIVVVTLLYTGNSPESRRKQQKRNDEADAAALLAVIAEAYIQINAAPDFVNTAKEYHPMEIPEKYYTYVESVQGDGRVHAVVYFDGKVDAYFGTPEKTVEYYAAYRSMTPPKERWEKYVKDNETDAENLRAVIAEACANITADPAFVNGATESRPSWVSTEYYTYAESVQGDGRVHVVIYADGHVDAYFGTPEKTADYYIDRIG